MSTPILTTKLYIPPRRPDIVLRPRLIERLNEGLHGKLTLLSAPAGFGKSTLLGEWVRQLDRVEPEIRVTWLSVEESDNDPPRFLSYFIAALRIVEANVGEGAQRALQSPQPPAEAVLTSLINEAAAIPDEVILVLDDYHLIEAQPIHRALDFLLEHLPPQLHLVIATREDPPLPLARLRARSQLTELRATDLRFTTAEAAEFLNQVMDLGLSADEIATLERRTEGWIAGLQLAALALQGAISPQGDAPGHGAPGGRSACRGRRGCGRGIAWEGASAGSAGRLHTDLRRRGSADGGAIVPGRGSGDDAGLHRRATGRIRGSRTEEGRYASSIPGPTPCRAVEPA